MIVASEEAVKTHRRTPRARVLGMATAVFRRVLWALASHPQTNCWPAWFENFRLRRDRTE